MSERGGLHMVAVLVLHEMIVGRRGRSGRDLHATGAFEQPHSVTDDLVALGALFGDDVAEQVTQEARDLVAIHCWRILGKKCCQLDAELFGALEAILGLFLECFAENDIQLARYAARLLRRRNNLWMTDTFE